jgi:hypothetical protein
MSKKKQTNKTVLKHNSWELALVITSGMLFFLFLIGAILYTSYNDRKFDRAYEIVLLSNWKEAPENDAAKEITKICSSEGEFEYQYVGNFLKYYSDITDTVYKNRDESKSPPLKLVSVKVPVYEHTFKFHCWK